jgi:hypothetical protein
MGRTNCAATRHLQGSQDRCLVDVAVRSSAMRLKSITGEHFRLSVPYDEIQFSLIQFSVTHRFLAAAS